MKVDGRASAARRSQLLQGPRGLALLEAHFPLEAVTLDRRRQVARERIDDRCADAVQAARRLVIGALEFPAGVEHREDDLERAVVRLRVLVHGIPRPSSVTVIEEPSSWSVSEIAEAKPFIASSTALSRISHTR